MEVVRGLTNKNIGSVPAMPLNILKDRLLDAVIYNRVPEKCL
jgi:hypothetical protein